MTLTTAPQQIDRHDIQPLLQYVSFALNTTDIVKISYCINKNVHDCFSLGIFNILGLPVTQCPLGLSREGLPLGVQLVAGKLQDRLCLATAVYLEKAFGGWTDPGKEPAAPTTTAP